MYEFSRWFWRLDTVFSNRAHRSAIFIDFEERDYQSRANAASEEEAPCKRRVPTAKEYNEAGGMYRAYAMRGGYTTSAKKKWGAQRPSSWKPPWGSTYQRYGARAPETRLNMAKLIGLWSRPPPGPPSKNAATEETIGEKSKPMEDCESRYLKRKRRAATETAKGTTETVKVQERLRELENRAKSQGLERQPEWKSPENCFRTSMVLAMNTGF